MHENIESLGLSCVKVAILLCKARLSPAVSKTNLTVWGQSLQLALYQEAGGTTHFLLLDFREKQTKPW